MATLDRIIPGAKGGMYEEGNVQLLCRRCNLRKGARRKSDRDRPNVAVQVQDLVDQGKHVPEHLLIGAMRRGYFLDYDGTLQRSGTPKHYKELQRNKEKNKRIRKQHRKNRVASRRTKMSKADRLMAQEVWRNASG